MLGLPATQKKDLTDIVFSFNNMVLPINWWDGESHRWKERQNNWLRGETNGCKNYDVRGIGWAWLDYG